MKGGQRGDCTRAELHRDFLGWALSPSVGNLAELQKSGWCIPYEGRVCVHINIGSAADLGETILQIHENQEEKS